MKNHTYPKCFPYSKHLICKPYARFHVLPLGFSASPILQSRISFVPKLPNPPSPLLSHPPSLTTKQVALSASPPTATSTA